MTNQGIVVNIHFAQVQKTTKEYKKYKKALAEATLKGQKSWNSLIHRFNNTIAFFKRNDPWKNINLEKEVILRSSQIAEFAIYELRR